MSVPLDQPVRLAFNTYSDTAGTIPADPTAITLDILDPTGVTTTHNWTGDITRDSVGAFHYTLTPATPGHYAFHWKATGTVATAQDGSFDVEPKYGSWLALPDVKAQLDITSTSNDGELQGVINAAVGILENHPGYRVKDAVTQTTYTEWYDGGGATIVLKHYPVTSVTSVAEYTPAAQALAAEPLDTTSSFTGYGYTLDSETGILSRTSGGLDSRFAGRVKIVYVAGSATVPAEIRDAALMLVEHIWVTRRGGQGTGLPSGLDADLDAGALGEQFGPSFILPNRVREALDAYRRAPAVA